MHAAKTKKSLFAVLATLGLLVGSLVGVSTPANAASVNGCINSGWTPNNCGGSGTAAVITALPADITGTTGTPIVTTSYSYTGCTPSSFKLYTSSDTSYATALTKVVGINFSGTTGQFSGTPTATLSTSGYVVLLTCSTGDLQRYSLNVTVTTGVAVPYLTPDSVFITGTAGTAIATSAALVASNITAPVAYSVTSGTLPAGLTLNADGSISGTPSSSNTSTIVVTGANGSSSATTEVTFEIEPAAVTPAPVVEPDRKVTICHRTHATTNPYVRITVDYNSVNRTSGHQGHDEIFAGEHVFKAGIYKRAKDKDWGDIIPADPSGLNRWQALNWTTLGQQIYNGTVDGCPTYNPTTYYNALREAGVPEGKIKAEIAQLETEQSEATPSRTPTNANTVTYTGSNASVTAEENDKVTICHATNATTNPYRKITVSASSITNRAGHYSHDDIYLTNHVFNSEVTYPANKKDWGDIIPADPSGLNRWQPLNWTALGQKIYSGEVAGCAGQTTQEIYNALREDGESKKDIVKDLTAQKNADDDIKDIDEVQYTGTDPVVELTEPKEPVLPSSLVVPAQSLSGIVWLDRNRDGLKDPDEPLMPGVTITLIGPDVLNGTPEELTAVTDENGLYIFPTITDGDWKVETVVPEGFGVTYDSDGNTDGEILTAVPLQGSAFTWVGLVGTSDAISDKLLEEIVLNNPEALPLSELPAWLQLKVAAKLAELEAAENAETLAYTGSEDYAYLFFGLLMMLAGALVLVSKKRK